MTEELTIQEKIDAEIQLREYLMGEVSIDTYQKNYLLEAGAGAGKTHTMVQRIINQLVLGQICPENLAAITFTEKATQEMLERIDKEINKRLQTAEEKDGKESEKAVFIRDLITRLDRMQISTIHGFCRKLLMTMPYESVLGPEFDVETDTDSLARDFFARALIENGSIFDEVQAKTGVQFNVLEESFVKMCETGAEILSAENAETESDKLEEKQKQLASEVFSLLLKSGKRENYKPRNKENLDKAQLSFDEIFKLLKEGEEAFTAALIKALDTYSDYSVFDATDIEHLMPRNTKNCTDKDTVKDCCKHIKRMIKERIHAYCVPVLRELVADYRRYKRENRIASQNDLLIYTRDMLRDSAEARKYFHNRYRTIYVDEMQDTNPIQAQLLFYLTTDEANFSKNWENCRPVPGSLFMVGDPKQAIYRFVGADITVYKKLMELFAGGVGEQRGFGLNFRSSEEVPAHVDSIFMNKMNQSSHQAEYAKMTAFRRRSPYSKIVSYEASKEEDPEHVAAFIARMIGDGVLIGFPKDKRIDEKDWRHPAKPADFMVLTSGKDTTAAYVSALARRGIACNMAGAMRFAESVRIASALRIISCLMDRSDEVKLTAVLYRCYSIPLPVLRTYKQRAKYLTANYLSVKKAMLAEGSVSAEFESVFAAMNELDRLYSAVKTLPAMTAMEEIFLKSAGVWGGCEPVDTRDYALICVFLNKLRSDGAAGFAELAARALDLSKGKGERELLLENKDDCVRVMNLHKAKGLEAQVVILANDKEERAHTPDSYTEYKDGEARTSMCLKAASDQRSWVVGQPANWEDDCKKEKNYLDAEQVRLLYVAETRAKTCLILNTHEKGPWKELAFKTEDPENTDAPKRPKVYEMEKKGDPEPQKPADPEPSDWTGVIETLATGVFENDAPKEAKAKPEPKVVSVSELEHDLNENVQAITVHGSIVMTPSMLDVDVKKQLNTEEPPAIEPEVPAETEPVVSKKPHGDDWGTIMHRIMELSVKNDSFSEADIARFARQATAETVGDATDLTARQRSMLLSGYAANPDYTPAAYLSDAAVEMASFLTDPGHGLRRLIDGAKCYTELPFILREKEPDSEIAKAVREGYANKAARLLERNAGLTDSDLELPIDVNGIIDLAVIKDNAWIIVDYKTDMRVCDESEADYIERLKQSYSAQLNAYKSVLNKMNLYSVDHVYICALNLGGKLIELD